MQNMTMNTWTKLLSLKINQNQIQISMQPIAIFQNVNNPKNKNPFKNNIMRLILDHRYKLIANLINNNKIIKFMIQINLRLFIKNNNSKESWNNK